MSRLRILAAALLLPGLAFLATGVLVGCGKDTKPVASTPPSEKDKDKGGTTPKKELAALEAKGKATIKGQVTYDGEAPKPQKLKFTDKAEKRCHEGDTDDLTWEVDPNSKGVKNVVIWVKPGDGTFFKADQLPKPGANASMDQPFCNFIPHVVAFNPSVFDGKKQVPTGQKFIVKNSAPIVHNTNWVGSPAIPGNADNKSLPAGNEIEVPVKPARDDRSGEDMLNIACNVHTWMTAKCWVLDTPFFAVTDKDGKFEIKDVPAGAEIHVIAWHEDTGANGYVLPAGSPGRQGQKITLTDGKDEVLNFKIKKN